MTEYTVFRKTDGHEFGQYANQFDAAEAADWLVANGNNAEDICVRPVTVHHAGEVFPGGLDLHLPGE